MSCFGDEQRDNSDVNVTELFGLTQWIDQAIKAKEIPQLYRNLHSVLQANATGNRPQQPFEDQKNQLIAAISAVPLESLSTEQVNFLQKLGIGDHVGQGAVRNIEDILFRNVIDPATAAQKCAE